MKKGLIFLFAILICVLLCACASNSDKEKETTTSSPTSEITTEEETTQEETTEEPKENQTIDFSTDKGEIKYVGFEKANAGLVDESNVYVIKFAFTNQQNEPSESRSAFSIKFFQNGVQIDTSLSYSSKGGEQYKLVGNYFSEVMKGGTVTYGRLVQLEDNSPITIMVSEQFNSDSYQMMELDVTKKSDKESNTKDNKSETKKETTTNAVKNIWSVDYYVDDFQEPTDEWYITNSTLFSGTFSNSAVTDANLTAMIIVDSKKDITFFLYEYGRNAVKNSSEYSVDKYNIVMRTSDGKDHNITGTLYCGGDRIFIDDKYVDTVLNALQGDGDVMFRFVQSDRTINTYLLKVTTGNFSEEYKSMTK